MSISKNLIKFFMSQLEKNVNAQFEKFKFGQKLYKSRFVSNVGI